MTVTVAMLATLTTLLFFNTVQALPIQRYLDNLFAHGPEQSFRNHQRYGIHEGNTGYSNNTLTQLETNFYSTEGITHDVFVKNVHSHNDYWRSRPLLEALERGVRSVEADVWHFTELKDPTIYVGHSLNSLDKRRTLNSLYLDPINAILRGANLKTGLKAVIDEKTKGLDLGEWESEVRDPSGVWFTDSHATLYFLIDFKTDGDELFPVIHESLEELRKHDWLSWYNTTSEEFHWGPVTVIGTGNTPLDKVLNQGERRDLFYDGPLDRLNEVMTEFGLGVSPMVSSSLKNLLGESIPLLALTDSQRQKIEQQIDYAHKLGVITRIWDTPWWPVSSQETISRQIIEAGSDLLNADDLRKATRFF